jgi:hypothetical protein
MEYKTYQHPVNKGTLYSVLIIKAIAEMRLLTINLNFIKK